MGIECYLRHITPHWLEQLTSDPTLGLQFVTAITPFVAEDQWKSMGIDTNDPQQIMDHLSRSGPVSAPLKHHLYEKQAVKAYLKQTFRDELLRGKLLDTHNAWDAIHAILSGTTELTGTTLDKVIKSGTKIGDDDKFNYGAPHFLTPAEVQAVYDAISPITKTEFRRRFDALSADEAELVYGFDQDETGFQQTWNVFRKVVDHYHEAAEEGLAMLVFFA